jgi:hypothetical protein
MVVPNTAISRKRALQSMGKSNEEDSAGIELTNAVNEISVLSLGS